jgi:hypothetical protein
MDLSHNICVSLAERRAEPRYPVPGNALRDCLTCRHYLTAWFFGGLRATPCQILSLSGHGLSLLIPKTFAITDVMDIRVRWINKSLTFPACSPVLMRPINTRKTVWMMHVRLNYDLMTEQDMTNLGLLRESLSGSLFWTDYLRDGKAVL